MITYLTSEQLEEKAVELLKETRKLFDLARETSEAYRIVHSYDRGDPELYRFTHNVETALDGILFNLERDQKAKPEGSLLSRAEMVKRKLWEERPYI